MRVVTFDNARDAASNEGGHMKREAGTGPEREGDRGRVGRRRSAAILLTIGALIGTVGCNPGRAEAPTTAKPTTSAATFTKDLSGTLKTSGFNPSDEVGKSRSDLATESVAPVKVEMDTTNFDPQKFAAQSASGQVPDLLQVERRIVATLADKGLILPLNECFQLWGVDPSKQYYEAPLKDVTYDGEIYGIPQFFQASILIGNRNIMKPAGVATADLDASNPKQIIDAAKKMAVVTDGKPKVVGFDADLPGSAGLWLAVFGGAPNDATGRPTLDAAKNLEALTWMKDLMDAQGGYAAIKSLKDSMDVFGDENQYVKNTVGVQTWAQWYVNVLANTKDKVSLVGIPITGQDGNVVGFAGGTAFAIPKNGRNPSAACAWAISATSLKAWEAAGAARAETVKTKNSLNTGLFTGSPIADKAIREQFVVPSGNADFDQLIETTYKMLDNTIAFGGSPVGQAITDALNNAVAVTLSGEKAPAAALQEAQASAMRAWDQSALGKRG